ncbi:MAG: hypothetical protein R2909_14815 [Gemmatimonadales bacterium]
MGSVHYEALEAALIAAGAPAAWSKTASGVQLTGAGPVAALVNTGVSAKPYSALLLDALPQLVGMEREMVIRALSERGMPKAGPVLAALMATDRSLTPMEGWAVGNALATIRDPATFGTVVTLCGDKRLGIARQMLFGLLPGIGTEAAYEAALAGLDDGTVRGHAIEAVGRFGRAEALDQLRVVATEAGKYETKAKATAIRRLERATSRRADA